MLEEGIPIIKEQVMSTPKFSGQAELGSASALMTKEWTMTRKEEYVMTSEFLGVARVLPLACANEHLLRRRDSLVAVQ